MWSHHARLNARGSASRRSTSPRCDPPRQQARPRTRAARGRARPRAGTASTRASPDLGAERSASRPGRGRAPARRRAGGRGSSGSPRQPASRAGGAKLASIPGFTAPPVPVEEADLLPGSPVIPGMPAQVGVQRGRAGLLGPEHEKVGQSPARSRAAVRPDRVARDLADGLGDPGIASAGRRRIPEP